jgi:ABC-type transporter Mla MlaB component
MLKISRIGAADHSVTLKLEGRVAGQWVDELSRICELVLGERCQLKLDLADVSFADTSGVSLLSSFKSRGVELQDCSPFVREQLKAH